MNDFPLFSAPQRPNSGAQVFKSGPRLLADIGGTNARFALEMSPGRIESVVVLPCADYPTLIAALHAYSQAPTVGAVVAAAIRHAAIAIANPVDGDQIRMTNHAWTFSIEAVRREMGFETLLVVNDFTALACALPHLSAEQKHQIGGGAARAGVIGLLGAGTGLGVSGMIPSGSSWIPLHSEGGHVTFSPCNEREIAILRFAWREFGHVSAERFLSGAGLELIYRALAELDGVVAPSLSAPEIARRALAGECVICDDTIATFCGMLGTVAGNIAITLGTQGGIYIGGGIVPRLGARFDQSSFRQRFEQKGRFSAYLSQVPTFVITAEYPAFTGVSAILADKLQEEI